MSPVAAVQPSPPGGHLSRVARLSLLVRLPAALVLGVRDALTRRLPAALTVAGVAIPLAMITIALAVLVHDRRLHRRPRQDRPGRRADRLHPGGP